MPERPRPVETTLQPIIEHIADSADDVLADAGSRAQARAGIEELLTADYPKLSPGERATIVSGVLQILEKEGFFEGDGGGNIWDEEVAGDEGAG